MIAFAIFCYLLVVFAVIAFGFLARKSEFFRDAVPTPTAKAYHEIRLVRKNTEGGE